MSTTIMMMRMKDSWTMIDVYTSFVSIADVVLKNVAQMLFFRIIDISGIIIERESRLWNLLET